jgi:hypothetical protein
MKRFMNKKVAAIGLVAGLVLGGGGVAFAYFTGSGTGTGSGSTGTATNTITVVGTETGALTPGTVISGSNVAFTASNGSNFSQKLSTIHLVSISATGEKGTCTPSVGATTASDFTMPDVTVGSDGDLAPNAGPVTLSETGTLTMNDTTLDQSGCEHATLALTFSTS